MYMRVLARACVHVHACARVWASNRGGWRVLTVAPLLRGSRVLPLSRDRAMPIIFVGVCFPGPETSNQTRRQRTSFRHMLLHAYHCVHARRFTTSMVYDADYDRAVRARV